VTGAPANPPPRPWSLPKRIAFGVLLTTLGLYVIALVAIFSLQRSMMYFPPQALAAPAEPAIQALKLHTADGESLTAWYLPPASGKPVILFFHGNGSSLSSEEGRWRRIQAAGVGFFAIGYRGYSGSSGHPTEAGLHEDALAAYKWLAERYAPKDIVIHGHSLGSGVAVRLASEKPARALILEAPFTSAVDRAAAQYGWAPVRLLMLDQFMSRDRIKAVHMPLLVVHGDHDSVIPFSDGQTLFALANSPKTFVRMVGSDHNTLTRDGIYDQVWRFLDIPISGTAASGHAARVQLVNEP
jgi:fermentation-respiration switch protein FrsA (DUF1100 family)